MLRSQKRPGSSRATKFLPGCCICKQRPRDMSDVRRPLGMAVVVVAIWTLRKSARACRRYLIFAFCSYRFRCSNGEGAVRRVMSGEPGSRRGMTKRWLAAGAVIGARGSASTRSSRRSAIRSASADTRASRSAYVRDRWMSQAASRSGVSLARSCSASAMRDGDAGVLVSSMRRNRNRVVQATLRAHSVRGCARCPRGWCPHPP